jgi:hypothetical protein
MTEKGQIDPSGSGDGKEGDSGRKGPVLDEQRRPGRLPVNARCRNCGLWVPPARYNPRRALPTTDRGECRRSMTQDERTFALTRCAAWIPLAGPDHTCPDCQDQGAAGACVYCGRLPAGREG